MKRAIVLPWVAMLLSVACVSSKPPGRAKTGDTVEPRPLGDHMRVVFQVAADAGTGSAIVQTSVRTLRHPGTGTVAVLLSMQHVGQAPYYRSMEEHLRDAKIVLAECTVGEGPGGALADDLLPEEGRWVGRHDRVMARLLDLELQTDWERRTADDRWVLADMSSAQIVESMKASDVAFVSGSEKARITRLEGLMAGSPSADELAKERADLESRLVSETYYYTGPRGAERKLQDEREVVMWRVVKDHLASHSHKRIAMVFGAWHTPYLESKLVSELGFRVEATCWHDAALCENFADINQAK